MKSQSRTKTKARKVLVIHGPNLHLLGKRETSIYGKSSINEINNALKDEARRLNLNLTFVQSNHEGRIVDIIGEAAQKFDGILINPAAFTHTSIAIRDALLACNLPAVEVHLSNIFKREEFRQKSITAPACCGHVTGFGNMSYILGLIGLSHSLES